MDGPTITLLIHLFNSFILLGIIWWIQLLAYPLFKEIPLPAFATYHQKYLSRASFLLIPLMIIELITGIGMILFPAEHIPRIPLLINFALIVLIWLGTILFQTPIHQKLSIKPSTEEINQLKRTNWIRTILWTLKGALLIWIVVQYQLFVETLTPVAH